MRLCCEEFSNNDGCIDLYEQDCVFNVMKNI